MQAITHTFEYPVINSSRRTPTWSLSKETMIEICFNIIDFCGSCWIAVIIGAISGWICGWCAALTYRSFYEPIDFISFASVNKWYYLPYEYGRLGLVIGAAAGVLVILAMTLKKMMKAEELEINQNSVKEEKLS